MVCLFVGCNWALFWPSAQNVFVIATIDESVVKIRYSASGPRRLPVEFYVFFIHAHGKKENNEGKR